MKRKCGPMILAVLAAALLICACGGPAVPAASTATPAPDGMSTTTPAPDSTPTATPEPERISFAGGAQFPADAEQIETPLAAGETALLERFERLRVAEVTGSEDYAELAAYRQAHPEVELRFAEEIGGVTIAWDAVSLDLTTVPIGELERVADLLPLVEGLKEVNLNRTEGAPVPDGADALAAAEPSGEAADREAIFASALGWQQLGLLQQARPDVRFDYVFTYLGKTFSTADAKVDLSGLDVGNDRVDEVRALAAYLTQCSELTMERCNVSNKRMAALRDALPQMKVVWRVSFGLASSRTDATRIRLVKDGYRFSTENLEPLRYCVDVELLDLGHNGLRNIDFVQYMPKLRVAILAIGYLEDLTPLSGCTELEYLELFTNRISDLTPLSGLENLRHLNLTYNRITDPTPLYSLTGLERLWIGRTDFTDEQKAALAAALPGCEIDYGNGPTGDGWRNHPRYDLLREQFDYEHPRNGGY